MGRKRGIKNLREVLMKNNSFMRNSFLQDARSFYDHRNGYNAFERASKFSNDAQEVYKNVLSKKTMEIIFDSARFEYGLEMNNFEILRAFLYEDNRRRRREYWGITSRIAKERTKFRQPKGAKIPKKPKELKEKVYNDNKRKEVRYYESRSKKWSKKMRAKSHRQWVRESFQLLDKGVDRFSKNGNREYKTAYPDWWW